jgi:hypothetical protein
LDTHVATGTISAHASVDAHSTTRAGLASATGKFHRATSSARSTRDKHAAAGSIGTRRCTRRHGEVATSITSTRSDVDVAAAAARGITGGD